MKKNQPGRRRPAPRTMEEMHARLEDIMDQYQECWLEGILSDAPRWGHVLGLHLRLCEIEHLEEAGLELLQ